MILQWTCPDPKCRNTQKLEVAQTTVIERDYSVVCMRCGEQSTVIVCVFEVKNMKFPTLDDA